jgi:hypothetical protein
LHQHDPATCTDPTHNHGHQHTYQSPVQILKEELQEKATNEEDDGIYNYDIFSIERREREMLQKYPDQAHRIRKALELDESEIMKKKEHEMSLDEVRIYRAQLQKEKVQKVYTERKAEKIQNTSYEK